MSTAPHNTSTHYIFRQWIRDHWPKLLLIVIASLVGAAIWYVWGGNEAWDDAFISFRYARNLAEGHGLVFNPGGERTQGFTNLLFVVLVTPSYKTGVGPEAWAFLWNTAGLALTGISFYALSVHLSRHQSWLSIIPALAVVWAPLSLANVITGMETVFAAGLTFVTAGFVLHYIRHKDRLSLVATGLFAFLSCLTRPEFAVFVVLWFALIIIAALPSAAARKQVAGLLIVFGGLSLLYLVALQLYFGDFLPNSFHVKANSPEHLPGQSYIDSFIDHWVTQAWVLIGLLGMVLTHFRRNSLVALAPYGVTLSLPVIYLFMSPLVGGNFRFLYAATCMITFAAAFGWVEGLQTIGAAITPRISSQTQHPRLTRYATLLVILMLCGWVLFGTTWEQTRARIDMGHSEDVPPSKLTQTGHLLAQVPQIEELVIAYGDAGKVPYYSRAQVVDVVGLNDNAIARNAPSNGSAWVIDYIFRQNPDLIAFYTLLDGTIFNEAHGIIGDAYSDLYTDPRFQERYTYAGGFKYPFGVYAQWFVYRHSSQEQALLNAIGRHADITAIDIIP